jgi:Flp pilus assembly protein TadG
MAMSTFFGNRAHIARRFRRLVPLRRFRRDQKGATAVEFGMIALPFLGLMFAIIETALVFFAGQTLETAVADSSRLIMTGQAQNGAFDKVKFKEAVCTRVKGLFDCSGQMKIDVRAYSQFAVANMSKPTATACNFPDSDFQYNPGGPGDIVVVRVVYKWPIFVGLWGLSLADMSGCGARLIMSTSTFRNEPF